MSLGATIQGLAERLRRGVGPLRPPARRPPFDDLAPTIEWQVCGRCNYDCSYCIQSRKRRRGAPDEETVRGIVASLGRLPGRWEIKMSGGEPFAFRGFMGWVIPGLVQRTPHAISVLTNFSAPAAVLERFCALTGDRLRITSASLHLEHTDVDAFVAKARAYRALRQRHNPRSSFVVNSVLVPGKLAALAQVKARLEGEGFRYFPQLMKVKGGVFPYDDADRARIQALTGGAVDPRAVNRAPSYRGLRCEAGAWYAVVDQHGDAYTCRTAKRYEDPREGLEEPARSQPDPDGAYMGNLARGTFARRAGGGVCAFDICPCTVPANRGIVRGIARQAGGATGGGRGAVDGGEGSHRGAEGSHRGI